MDNHSEGLLVVAVIVVVDICIISLFKLLFGKPQNIK